MNQDRRYRSNVRGGGHGRRQNISSTKSKSNDPSLNKKCSFLREELTVIFTGLNNLSVQDAKDSKRIVVLLESLHSFMESNKSSIKHDDDNNIDDFSQELSRLNQFLFDIKTLLNNVDNYNEDLFNLQYLMLKSFYILLKATKIINESTLFADILEHLIDHLIQIKIMICKLSSGNNQQQNIITLNSSCLLLLKCIYFFCSKFTIIYGNNLRKTNVSGKLIGILRCFMFYGLSKYDLESFPVNLYPSPLSQFMIKDNNGRKRRNNNNNNKFDNDEIFDDTHLPSTTTATIESSNLSTSEYSSSELDESTISTIDTILSLRREYQNRKSFVKIRMFSYECLRVSLDIFDIRTVFGFWSFLFPDTNLSWPLNDSTEFSVLTTISNDTSNSVRISALNFMFNFFDYSKQYVQILVQDSTTTTSIGGKSSSFTPISVSLATMIKELHRFFHYILLKENNCSILILLYKILSLIISITPYHKLSDDEILNQLFNQNCYMIDNKVTQIKNLSLALYVKIFNLSTIPTGLESWIFETESGRITMNKIFKHCYEFIDNQDYILLIIESIKLFISILRHYKFARKLLSKKCIEKFNVEMFFMKISFKIIEMDKAYNNSVLQTLMCKFIHTIGLFFKDLSSTTCEDDYKIFPDLHTQEDFIKQWYLKIISTKIFHIALKEQNSLIIQNSSQITLINVISIIPENIFKLFNENIHFEIISILISLAKIDNHHDYDDNVINNNKQQNIDNEETDLWIYTKSTSIRCLSIIQSYNCFSNDLTLILDLIDICIMDVLNKSDDYYQMMMARKKQIFLFEHILWSLANILDNVKKSESLQSSIELKYFVNILEILEKFHSKLTNSTDDMLINLVRNSSLIIYLILSKQNSSDQSNEIQINPDQIQIKMIKYMNEILAEKKSYKLQWNICIGFSYLFPMENFIKLCEVDDLIDRIMNTLYQTFLNSINHKVQSYSIYTISCIYDLKIFEKYLPKLWSSLTKKFIENLFIVPIHNRHTWLDRFIFVIEKFFIEFVQPNDQDDPLDFFFHW
uniref:Uncharacterized protein LOC113792465 n=1 Tax=Dermatophagoides pteronyssinus TaxID=6956 RepID=A0A6P6XXV2_DERPT|nr:uncharacterized protein LOC113792465 [Dermatophagoides pteronyssinus]